MENLLVTARSLLLRHHELAPILLKFFPECKQEVTAQMKREQLNELMSCEIQLTDELKNTIFLTDLANLLLMDSMTVEVATLFSPVLLDLLIRAALMARTHIAKHEWLIICLSKLVWYFPDVARFAREYFEHSPNIFHRYEEGYVPPPKKDKIELKEAASFKLLRAAYMFLIYDMETYKDLCDWSILIRFLTDEKQNHRTRWFAYQCIGRLGNVKNVHDLIKNKFSSHEYLMCFAEEEENQLWSFSHFQHFEGRTNAADAPKLTLRKKDFCKNIVNVEGVLLNRKKHCLELYMNKEDFAYVPSARVSLFRLALAVSAGEPVLLQGSVGCGKTSLVEHLALLTGRQPYEELLKIQLGDHMDSKMLLGTHVCTDIPGQFVWKSGVLVQAMTKGCWLLLEDIDCAPMDVISLLIPVIQSRSIVVPGHAERIKAAAGFQLFATQRLIRGIEGSYVEFRSNMHITHQFRKIMIEPFSRDELKAIISTKWPHLEQSADKLLEIYNLFSADFGNQEEQSSSKEPLNLYSNHGRLVSTRDLFKFCGRLAAGFKKCQTDINFVAFQNAVDCFCDSIPSCEMRRSAAESFANMFNVSTTKLKAMEQQMPKIEIKADSVRIGRVSFQVPDNPLDFQDEEVQRPVFAFTRHSSVLLDKVAVAATHKEPVLLVGETGTGKTSVVQYLAYITKRKLTVINMSQQSDSVDLIGGYKPVDLIHSVKPIRDKFWDLLNGCTFLKKNPLFQKNVDFCYFTKRYEKMLRAMLFGICKITDYYRKENKDNTQVISSWSALRKDVVAVIQQVTKSKNMLIFKFIEGALVKAMKNGEWLLLDEINLAEAETLECLSGILERNDNTLFLYEKGSKEPVKRHPDFRIFACMNPATDVGKKDLPVGIRNRFTEIFVDEIDDKQDLTILVKEYLKTLFLNAASIENIVTFYLHIKKIASVILSDGTGHYPHYSLRTLCRALKYASGNPCHNVPRSLYEAFCLSFLSQLDNESHAAVMKEIREKLLGKSSSSVLKQSIPEPRNGEYKQFEGYWIQKGNLECKVSEKYIFTNTVRRNLQDLARIVSASKYPVLLQGETSVGKTSLIHWLAAASGNKCVRINNHEHTDIQEYVGTYSADASGKLVFKEGILAEAMRHGYWIILDELNLAPTEVMEALNRVLDDNRELFIPETQTLIKAHPGFMIFATQNPPGLYGGRKLLSRAFRNRFIELHFNEIPRSELEEILQKRCQLPMQYSQKLVAVMHDLQTFRRESGVFCGKQGFITLRDLFRWGERYKKTPDPPDGLDWLQLLADEGYLLLAGRVRVEEEIKIIQTTLKKHLKREVNPTLLFDLDKNTSVSTKDILTKVMNAKLSDNFKNVVWTRNMRRLAVLVGKAMEYKEPVLLIGTTGSGKTTICQIFAEIFGKKLHSVNCHMHSESSDFLGGLRPVRDRDLRKSKLFEWVDGPLVLAMKEGNFFLSDEISLADDSVLERLNSVLEPEQKILVPERSFDSSDDFEIAAVEGFQFFATMNPGGDYGKKELSPALRNRFTEIWCPSSMNELSDIMAIVDHNVNKNIMLISHASKRTSGFGRAIAQFLNYYSNTEFGRRVTLSIRDVLTWVEFINVSQTREIATQEEEKDEYNLSPEEAYIHGAFLAIIDGIGSGSSALNNENSILEIKKGCFDFLTNQLREENIQLRNIQLMMPELFEEEFEKVSVALNPERACFGLGPFAVNCGSKYDRNWEENENYALDGNTTKVNVLKILRAMQLPKPMLLEGSPGVGKTSLITVLAKATGHNIMRINLSEQTDITDLFGADLPVDGGENGEFEWRDGPLIQALKRGDWILLDELNLASQSVLEGLNACLDHRNQIYIPELGKTFHLDKNVSRIFCCQNPQMQGGSRKGLPQSFLNRFTKVYMKLLDASDMEYIASAVYQNINNNLLSAMVQFNDEIAHEVNVRRSLGQLGAPWEFNLRDIFRWCDLMVHNQSNSDYNIGEYMKLIYVDRMRTSDDREKIIRKFEEVIKRSGLGSDQMVKNRNLKLTLYDNCVQVGYSYLPSKGICRGSGTMSCIAPFQLPFMESLMKCIEMNWMAILVGPSGSGKSTLVRVLAELCGQQLHVLSVNSEMDTIELLGGFEQADINRKVEFIAQDLEPVLEQCINACFVSDIPDVEKKLECLFHKHHNVKKAINLSKSFDESNWRQKLNCLNELISALGSFKLEGTLSILQSCSKILHDITDKTKGLPSTEIFNGGQFEWIDSMLIQAAIKGHWLLIDDANFCSPSVLDRLNALLEPGGVLTINEQGIVDGELRTITPHKDFRIILTLNPQYGEISRAMRNRGVEIFVEPYKLCDIPPSKKLLNTSILAECKGLIHNELSYNFFVLYQKLCCLQELDPPSLTDFLSAVSLFLQMLQTHKDRFRAFRDSCVAVFAERYLNVYAKNIVQNIIEEQIKEIINIQKKSDGHISIAGKDCTIPITDYLPSIYDYRQGPLFAALKKQASLYTLFFRHYLGNIYNCAPYPGNKTYVCPPPSTIFSVRDVIKVFTFVMKTVFETCPKHCYQHMIFFLWYWVTSKFPKVKDSKVDAVQLFQSLVRNYQSTVREVYDGSLMMKLVDSTERMFSEVGYTNISSSEVPFDFKWNQHLYQKMMIYIRQKDEDADNVEYEYISSANRISLLLHFKSLKFFREFETHKTPTIASLAAEVENNPSNYRDRDQYPLLYLRRFSHELEESIVNLISDETVSCSDEYYWKLFDAIQYYHVFQLRYLSTAEREIESTMRVIAFYVNFFLKKLRSLYQGICNMPSSLANAAFEVESNLAYNTPAHKFRRKCMKLVGLPNCFREPMRAEHYNFIMEVFEYLNLIDRLRSPQTTIIDLKVILRNWKTWIMTLGEAIFGIIYGKYNPKGTLIHQIKTQMIDSGIMHVDDDDILDCVQEAAEQPTITNTGLALEIQLFPLWDFLFLTYEAEVLSQSKILTNAMTEPELMNIITKSNVFLSWGTIIGMNPVHISHLIALIEKKNQASLTPALVCFFRHTRLGFASDGLLALNVETKDSKVEIRPEINNYWQKKYSWTNQYPLLTHIFSSLYSKSTESLISHIPLSSYSEKINQLQKAQAIIWKHFDKFASPNETFRRSSASIITSWFRKLLTAMALLDEDGKPPEIDILKLDKTDLLKLIDQWKIMPIIKTEGNDNILFLATENVIELQAKLNERIEDSKLQWVTGKAATLVGLLTSVLLMPRDYIDPGRKAKYKCHAFHEMGFNLHIEREVRNWFYNITCGQSLKSEWVAEHPHLRHFEDIYMAYTKRKAELEKKIPIRFSEEFYYNMQSELKHYLDYEGNPNTIIDIITNLNIVNNMTDENDLSQCDFKPLAIVMKARQIAGNLEVFVDDMLKKHFVFPDLIYPFLLGVEQIIFGLNMSCNSIIVKEAVNNDPPEKLRHMNEFLGMYISFSSDNCKSPLQMASTILNRDAFEDLRAVLSFTKNYYPSTGRLLYKMIKSAILELTNEIKLQKNFSENKLSEIKSLLHAAFQYLYKAWQVQNEVKKRKKEEEAQLFKTHHHEDEMTDEVIMEKELKELFPHYEEEVKGKAESEMDSFESESKAKSSSQKTSQIDYDDMDSMPFSDQDMFEVCQLHATAISLLANKNPHQNNIYINNKKELDLVTPILLRHEVLSCVIKTLGHRLDSTLEKTMIREQLLLCQQIQQMKCSEDDAYYDIYYDPNPRVIIKINQLLENLMNRVTALLKEFPGDPNLIQILIITERVLSFPVSDPVMKFVAGLEYVLETAQHWEQNAHKRVSIRLELEAISNAVVEYRKLELQLWRKSLQNVIKKQYIKSSKWWFFMFPLFYTDNTYDDSEREIIIKGIQKCLEDAPIGEFIAILSILRTFLHEYSLGPSNKQSRSYENILFNTYTYYEQFLPAIEKEIDSVREPVEKKLVEFLAQHKYYDLNFYAIKESVARSHRTLLKHIKTFENALQKPAKTAFTLPSKNVDDDQNRWSLDITDEDYICKMPNVRVDCFKKRTEPFFQKFPKYQKKVKKIAKEIGTNFPVAYYVNNLNDFCGEIIKKLEEVQKPDVEPKDSKEGGSAQSGQKPKSDKKPKSKIHSKKIALEGLLKDLQKIGLSYRRGMMRFQEDRIAEIMSLPAFDIHKMKVLKCDNSFRELLLSSSIDTNHYFYKGIAQYVQLQKLMEAPSKDITFDEMHKIQGYSGHLLTLVSLQRIQLVKLLKDIDNIGCFTSMLSTMYKKGYFGYEKHLTIIPPQKFFKESNLEMSNFMEIVSLTVLEFDALLECAPRSDHDIWTPSSTNRSLCNVKRNDDRWTIIKFAINNFNSEMESLLKQFSELKLSENIVLWDNIRTFGALCQSIQKALEKLMTKIRQHYDVDCLMVQKLASIYNKVVEKKTSAQDEEEKIIDSQMDENVTVEESEQSRILAKLCQQLATQIILGIQKMLLFSSSFEDKHDSGDCDGLFTIKITESLAAAKDCLHFDKILKNIKKLKVHFKNFQNSTEALLANDKSLRLLVNLAPVLNQYYQIMKVYLAISLGMHRTTCKFLTILLGVFSILAVKGYCNEPESEETSNSGGTQFVNNEDAGLGEGEGTKNVSSNIETEDQLDEAIKEGEEKKNEEQNDKDLKDEEDGIEMSDDFEGKLYGGEGNEEKSDDEEEKDDYDDLDRQGGDVDSDDAEKLDDKIWGSDSENEEDLRDDDGTGGTTDKMQSELVAKDNRYKDDSDEDFSEKENQPQDVSFDEFNEEYEGEMPDPMINASPSAEPEIEELPENMEITEEVEKDVQDENIEEMMEPDDKLNKSEDEPEAGDDAEEKNEKEPGDFTEEEKESDNIANQEEAEEPADESMESSEYILPTELPTTEDKALPSSETKKSSSDPVQSEENMDWDSGAQSGEEHHKEGVSEAKNAPSEDSGHEGKRSSGKQTAMEESKQAPKLKPPSDNRSVDESADEHNAKKHPIMDKKRNIPQKNEDMGDTAEKYEHISREEESKVQAIDIASKEQAEIRTTEKQDQDNDDHPDVVELSSDEEEETCDKSVGESLKTSQGHKKPGERGDEKGEMEDIPDGEIVPTHSAARSTESTFHTQSELWKSYSSGSQPIQRFRHMENVHMVVGGSFSASDEQWRRREMSVDNFAQELCEQLRLVLEPTKMSKFKGDYRTGKRLNMRKIIPYIASQFRKDKIWLRRTKPSKRQYQIMLAVDDSKSMGYNKVKELAFESLAVLGKSLTLLEAGELSVVSFGERVQLLHGFQEQFTTSTGARIVEHITFSQNKTYIAQLLDYATGAMVEARHSSHQSSKETAQLLIIISDGRTIYSEGMRRVKAAVKNARDNNIFMVYLVLDNVAENKSSVLDAKYALPKGDEVECIPYMDVFPFPFYIILREISALPKVLGEALRQWFELVTSVDR